MTAKEKLVRARTGLVLDQVFFGSLALRLTMVEDPNCETLWTDGTLMGYNPKFVEEKLSLDELKACICHEVMHNAMGHQARKGDREHYRWNVSCDFAVNGIIEDGGMKLPEGRLRSPEYDGKSSEEIYAHLPDNPQGGKGSGQGQQQDPGGCGEVRDNKDKDGKKASPSEMSNNAQDWKIAVAQAAQQAKQMGNLPAGAERWIKEITEPKVDWREVLRRFVDQTARNDYRWFPPNRRFIHQGIYLPTVKSEELKPIVVAVDTSGSIGEKELSQFSSEITAILEDYKTSCIVLYCDAAIAGVQEVGYDELPLKLKPKGGGGTSFKPVFKWVEKHGKEPSCLIYLTDLCGDFPDKEPEYPVLWGAIGGYIQEAPFGEVVEIKE